MVHRRMSSVLMYEEEFDVYPDGHTVAGAVHVGTGSKDKWDRNNYWRGKPLLAGDSGGPLTIIAHEYEQNAPKFKVTVKVGSVIHHVTNTMLIPQYGAFSDSTFPTLPTPTDDSLMGRGTTAIARSIPTNPVSGAANFVGELKRDGLPSLVGINTIRDRAKALTYGGSGARTSRNLSDEYLNVEFGWKPLVADLLKFGNAVRETDKVISRLHRDSGRNVRRRYSFPDESETTYTYLGVAYPRVGSIGSDISVSGKGKLELVEQTTRKSWFSGCFTYHLDMGSSIQAKSSRFLQEADKLFGVKLTPSVVWNLAPWSWAADWFGNFGDIATNLSAFSADGLAMRYGYIMDQTTRSRTYTLSGVTSKSAGKLPTCHQTFTTVVKRRVAASPFGFGLTWSGLSARQLAITAALGISQGGTRFSK